MLFTYGKDRFYEKMMQEIPGFHRDNYPRKSDSSYKYKFGDIDCTYCNEKKSCENGLCPYITENISDLSFDDDFWAAVKSAETCLTKQKATLLMLKECGV